MLCLLVWTKQSQDNKVVVANLETLHHRASLIEHALTSWRLLSLAHQIACIRSGIDGLYERDCQIFGPQPLGWPWAGRDGAAGGVSTRSSSNIGTDIVSIVLVQGLNAHPYYTWTGGRKITETVVSSSKKWTKSLPFRKRSQPDQLSAIHEAEAQISDFFWPRDLLPSSLPPCTISTYSYPSD